MSDQAAPGWYPDPSGQHDLRYWEGAAWTNRVASGNRGTDETGGADNSGYGPPPTWPPSRPASHSPLEPGSGESGVGPPPWGWFAGGFVTAMVAVGGSVMVEPGWFEAAEFGAGGIAFLAPLAFAVLGAGVWAGAIGTRSKGSGVSLPLLAGIVGGLTAVGVYADGGPGDQFGAAVALLAIIVGATGLPVFLVGVILGSIQRLLSRSGEPEEIAPTTAPRSYVKFGDGYD